MKYFANADGKFLINFSEIHEKSNETINSFLSIAVLIFSSQIDLKMFANSLTIYFSSEVSYLIDAAYNFDKYELS
jgi:hypothetical protein